MTIAIDKLLDACYTIRNTYCEFFFIEKKGVRMTPEKYGLVQLNGFPSYCTVLQKFRDSKERAKLRMWPPYKTPLLTHMYVSFSSTLHLSQVIKQSSKHKLVRVSIRIIKATYNRHTTSSELRYSGLARIYVGCWKEDTTREVEIKSQKVYLNSFFFCENKEKPTLRESAPDQTCSSEVSGGSILHTRMSVC